jgi:hypothetical protein
MRDALREPPSRISVWTSMPEMRQACWTTICSTLVPPNSLTGYELPYPKTTAGTGLIAMR